MLRIKQLLKNHYWRKMSTAQPETERPSYTIKESMLRLAPHAQTLTFMMSGVGLLMFSAATLRNLQDQISHNDNLLREKIDSLRNECRLEVEKSKTESARTAMEYHLKYKHSEEYANFRKLEPSTAFASSSVISIAPEPLN